MQPLCTTLKPFLYFQRRQQLQRRHAFFWLIFSCHPSIHFHLFRSILFSSFYKTTTGCRSSFLAIRGIRVLMFNFIIHLVQERCLHTKEYTSSGGAYIHGPVSSMQLPCNSFPLSGLYCARMYFNTMTTDGDLQSATRSRLIFFVFFFSSVLQSVLSLDVVVT